MQIAYVVISGNERGKRIGVVKYLDNGYYPTNYDHHVTEEECHKHVRLINDEMGVSSEVEEAMMAGSMFGWRVPAAKAALDHFGKPTD